VIIKKINVCVFEKQVMYVVKILVYKHQFFNYYSCLSVILDGV